jgi:hypothetical protein
VDGLTNWRLARILSVIDAYTQERLALQANVWGTDMTRVPEQLIAKCG